MPNIKRTELIGKAGIYKVYSKSDPGLFYIGSSVNLYRRLNPSKHHILKIIHDYDYNILKICEPEWLQFWEIHFISELNPPLNSNMNNGAQNSNAKNAMLSAMHDMGKSIMQLNHLHRNLINAGKENIFYATYEQYYNKELFI